MWSPIEIDELRELIRQSEAEMNLPEKRLWELMALPVEKWALSPWGDLGGGFWAVGLIGQQVIWFNDIEDGFNVSPYVRFGVISEYRCEQDKLHHVIYRLWQQIECGTTFGHFGLTESLDAGDTKS